MKKLLITALLFLVLVGVVAFPVAQVNAFDFPQAPSFKVDICHATGSEENPYNPQNVSAFAVDGIGGGDHNRSGHQNGEDIIPPFHDNGVDGYWNSRNWDEEGQAIWRNDCELPSPPVDYCDTIEGVQPRDYDCPKDSPTDVPQGNGGTPPTFAGSSTEAPKPVTCTIPFEVARTWYDNEELKWATDAQGIQKFSITYGPDKDHLVYGVDNIVPSARAIAKPESDWSQTWFSVWTWVNGCANQSAPIDP